jgi:hypothetical protein
LVAWATCTGAWFIATSVQTSCTESLAICIEHLTTQTQSLSACVAIDIDSADLADHHRTPMADRLTPMGASPKGFIRLNRPIVESDTTFCRSLNSVDELRALAADPNPTACDRPETRLPGAS